LLPPFGGRAQATGIITKGDRMMIDAVIYMGCGMFGGVALVALAALALDAIADAQAKGRKATDGDEWEEPGGYLLHEGEMTDEQRAQLWAEWLEEVRQEEEGT
jgi:hypothetical protein